SPPQGAAWPAAPRPGSWSVQVRRGIRGLRERSFLSPSDLILGGSDAQRRHELWVASSAERSRPLSERPRKSTSLQQTIVTNVHRYQREVPGASRKRCINTKSSQRPNLCPTSRKCA